MPRNDSTVDTLDLLHRRTSIPAKFLREPAPAGEELDAIFKAAVTAPDHGALRPWRFLVVEGDARKKLGDVFAEAIVKRDADTPPDQIERQRDKPMRSPLLVVVVATIEPNIAKVPESEQLLSAGAAAQHMQLAAQAMGYGSVWVTGPNATDATVRAALGVQNHDEIVGFLHFGTPSIGPPLVTRPDPKQFVEQWTGPAAEQ
ncbi:MAG: nitroreductase [Pseudomonadota bacterium]